MEYLQLAWYAFSAAFSWFWSLITADSFMFAIFRLTLVVGVVVRLFVVPFIGATWTHEIWSDVRQNRKNRFAKDKQKSGGKK